MNWRGRNGGRAFVGSIVAVLEEGFVVEGRVGEEDCRGLSEM